MFRKWFFLVIFTRLMFANEPSFGTYNGTAVILDMGSGTKEIFGNFSEERLHPCSTFKILNSLIALETQAIADENEIIPWDGIKRTYDFWNKDHSMRSAIAVSTVWFIKS